LLAELRLRLPVSGEALEAHGYRIAYCSVRGHEGVELLVADEWVRRVIELTQPQLRQP
jgi:hypothetical protein